MVTPEDYFAKLIEEKLHTSLDGMLLSDTGESLAQLKQVKVLKDWYRRSRETGEINENSSGNDLGIVSLLRSKLKDPFAIFAKESSKQVSKNIRVRLREEALKRAAKGFDLPAISLPSFRPSLVFSVLVNGLPIPKNKLQISFELAFIVEAKGIRVNLESTARTFTVGLLGLHIKLYAVTPMVIGDKKIKLGEDKLGILEGLEFAL